MKDNYWKTLLCYQTFISMYPSNRVVTNTCLHIFDANLGKSVQLQSCFSLFQQKKKWRNFIYFIIIFTLFLLTQIFISYLKIIKSRNATNFRRYLLLRPRWNWLFFSYFHCRSKLIKFVFILKIRFFCKW